VLKGDFSCLSEKKRNGKLWSCERWKALMRKWSGKLLL
jgi:hypothetical protein